MKKFKVGFRGYNTNQVNSFLDDVILKLEKIVIDSKEKDKMLALKDKTIQDLHYEIKRYKGIEQTLNQTISSVQANSERIRLQAKETSDNIINESRRNANRIISEALTRAEKVEYRAELLKKNINRYKSRMKNMLEQQLDLINDMDSEDYKINDRDDIL